MRNKNDGAADSLCLIGKAPSNCLCPVPCAQMFLRGFSNVNGSQSPRINNLIQKRGSTFADAGRVICTLLVTVRNDSVLTDWGILGITTNNVGLQQFCGESKDRP